MHELIHTIITWYMLHMSYLTITLLMMIESTFLPLPSELIVPPAAWKAASGDMNILLVILFGTIGALIGSLINYGLSYILGRKIIYALADTKLARICMVTPEKIEKAEHYFLSHGRSSIFIGRLVPVIRHLISIPAGLAKMPLRDFIVYTILGAGIWNIILGVLGFFLYTQRALLNLYFKEITYGLLVLGVLFALYLIFQGKLKRNS
jgi:membrane protein DedA with SNARE-associated domain